MCDTRDILLNGELPCGLLAPTAELSHSEEKNYRIPSLVTANLDVHETPEEEESLSGTETSDTEQIHQKQSVFNLFGKKREVEEIPSEEESSNASEMSTTRKTHCGKEKIETSNTEENYRERKKLSSSSSFREVHEIGDIPFEEEPSESEAPSTQAPYRNKKKAKELRSDPERDSS